MRVAGIRALGLAALAVLTALTWSARDAIAYDRDAWARDYLQLKGELAQRYANLDWVVAQRGVDLPALDARARAALERARSDAQAVRALRAFIAATI